jgi:hypothetical protein
VNKQHEMFLFGDGHKMGMRPGVERLNLYSCETRMLMIYLIDRNRDASSGLELTLNGLVHMLRGRTRNPDFAALVATMNIDIFKQVKMSIYKAVNSRFLHVQFSAANGAVRIFHALFSVVGKHLRLGSFRKYHIHSAESIAARHDNRNSCFS